jgi:hypothetical protein
MIINGFRFSFFLGLIGLSLSESLKITASITKLSKDPVIMNLKRLYPTIARKAPIRPLHLLST